MKAKKKRATIAQVSELAGVSAGTISSFLNNRNYGIRIGADTQRRILEACRKLNYIPKGESATRRLYPRLGDICFLINSAVSGGIRHQYFGQMFDGVLGSLEGMDQTVSYALFDPAVDYLKEPEKLPSPLRNGSSTRFVAASSPNPTLIRYAVEANLPVVCLGHHLESPRLCCIVPDYVEAARQAVQYLASLGHTRIAYLTGPFGDQSYIMLEMERGFSDAMREADLKLYPEYIYHCEWYLSEVQRDHVIEAVNHLMKLTPRPTAILCFHDPIAVMVSTYLQSCGLHVPRDMSVMGFNDEPVASSHYPALTTVRFPLQEMGAQAVAELTRQLDEGPVAKLIKLPTCLIERASCAPPAEPNASAQDDDPPRIQAPAGNGVVH